MRVADFVAKFITNNLQTKHIFGVTGAGIMHLTDGVACNKDLQWVALHDERSCAMAADAYSRASNSIGVCMVSTGPAATNAFTGVAGAWQDSVPMLVISGQVARDQFPYGNMRQGGVQELTIIPMVKHITKYATTITEPDAILYELSKAISIANDGRSGPVWLEIPMDVQAATVDEDTLLQFEHTVDEVPDFSLELHDVYQMLKHSKRPVVIAGRGVRLSFAEKLIAQLCEHCSIPIVTPYLGIDNLPFHHPCNIGVTGVKGHQAANLAMQNSDLIIAVGTTLHNTVTGYSWKDFAPNAQLVVINNDLSSQRTEVLKRAYCINADAFDFMFQLDLSHSYAEWLKQCQDWKAEYPVFKPSYSHQNIYSYIEQLNSVIEPNAIIISDAGSAFYCTSQGIKIRDEQRYITSGAMATMGFSVPAAIGAWYATKRPIWAIIGDGSLQQCLAELGCIKGLPIKIIVLKNEGYLSIRNSQRNYYNSRFIGCEPPMLSVFYPPEVIIAECLRDQEVLPSVQSWVNPDGSMSCSTLDNMKR